MFISLGKIFCCVLFCFQWHSSAFDVGCANKRRSIKNFSLKNPIVFGFIHTHQNMRVGEKHNRQRKIPIVLICKYQFKINLAAV